MCQPRLSSSETLELEALPSVGEPTGTGRYPLSYAQESLWLFEQMVPGTPTYNLPEAWVLNGHLNALALQQSLDRIVGRHETLRTIFQAQHGAPKQVILGAAQMNLGIVDLTQSVDPELELERELRFEACRPFDLSHAPLARAILFRLAAKRHVFLLNLHHIISDAWSQRVFMRELVDWYTAFATGKPCAQENPLAIQYADFALWQREIVNSEWGQAHLRYWRDKFRTAVRLVRLPLDHPRPAVRAYHGATQFSVVPGCLVDALKELSRREGTTLFMTLLAAFKTLLHRYTQQEDIVVGSPMAGRERVELERMIGFFVNTHLLRSDLSGDPTFAQLLGRVREVVLGAYAHQETPSEFWMQGLPTDGSAPGLPLLPVVFGCQSASPESWSLPGLEATKMELDTGTSKFDWTVLASECRDGLRLRSEFSTDLFEPGTMLRLLHQYQILLEGIVAAPESRISELPLQTQAERDQILIDWNQTTTQYERESCIQEIFEAQAAKTPDAVALVFQGRSLTYGQLNWRANQLAHRLQACGVGPGAKVGLCLEHSFEMVVAILSILKAGGAYIPLDPACPEEHLAFMLRDCGVSVLVTDSAWVSKLTVPLRVDELICLDQEQEGLARQNPQNLKTCASASSLAYVMYTSGSTGTPKGNLIPHRGVARLVRNTNYLEFSREHVFLQLAPITFDASTLEIWGALLNGARLVIFPPHLPSLEELGRTIRDNGVTTLWLTAELFRQMIDHNPEALLGVKYLLAGGDVLSSVHVAKALRELRQCQFINGYGPTENTTFTCCYRLPRAWTQSQSVPIGRPIANTQVYLLDKHMEPVPIGVPGELYTSGDGLAQGYLNQPELTAEKFVPNPFTNESKLYRTGDIGRWLPDGNLEFLGRADNQTKIRGYRVEPGEVERALASHPAVGAAVVVARADKCAGKQLVAYAVAQPGEEITPGELQEFLEAKLPPYMVPAHFLILRELPLNPNGKIDRRALPEPALDEPQPGAEAEAAPQTPTEQLVSTIWCELLGRQRIGVHQDFFRLGGHSLLATQVISRLSKTCKVELPVVVIFEARTVARLAAEIERAQREEPSRDVPVILRAGAARAGELLQRLDEFTESELEELLHDPELKSLSS